MMGIGGFKTKKALKGHVGQDVEGHLIETSMFGAEYKGNGTYAVVGPDPYVRKWFAQITIEDGKLTKVT